jgi:hypothetical protein
MPAKKRTYFEQLDGVSATYLIFDSALFVARLTARFCRPRLVCQLFYEVMDGKARDAFTKASNALTKSGEANTKADDAETKSGNAVTASSNAQTLATGARKEADSQLSALTKCHSSVRMDMLRSQQTRLRQRNIGRFFRGVFLYSCHPKNGP